MWVKPQEILVATAFWQGTLLIKVSERILMVGFRLTERSNLYFILQTRRGHGTAKNNLASLIIGTFDNVLDSKVCDTLVSVV